MRSANVFTCLSKLVAAKGRLIGPIFLWGTFTLAIVLLVPSGTLAQCGSCGCPAGQDCYCGLEYELGYCYCVPGTPILVDLDGAGFRLTNPTQGVPFDFFMSGAVQISWTAPGADEGWLVLPSGDGSVENGTQMFGNLTPQPPSEDPNGFAALAVYDDPKKGGNGDGIIDSRDAIFSRLRIWRDSNHNGISEPIELLTLSDAGIVSISLSYSETGYIDKWGNRFRYRARIASNSGADKWAYDVILQFNKISATASARQSAWPTASKRLTSDTPSHSSSVESRDLWSKSGSSDERFEPSSSGFVNSSRLESRFVNLTMFSIARAAKWISEHSRYIVAGWLLDDPTAFGNFHRT